MRHFTYQYGSLSDAGDVRSENQDAILCCTGEKNTQNQQNDAAFFLVADGMGGLSYGSQVSAYCTDQFTAWWHEDFSQMMQAGRDSDTDIKELLEQEIWDINTRIYQFKEREGCRCGSTLSALLLYNGKYYIENLGDSRIYRFRKNDLEQLTKDQSLAAQLVREKRLTPEEAEDFPRKNVLTMCIGMFQIPQSGFEMGELKNGDMFLLCSDGFYGCVEEADVKEILTRYNRQHDKGNGILQFAVEKLRSLIPEGAARDNVSLILTEVRKG